MNNEKDDDDDDEKRKRKKKMRGLGPEEGEGHYEGDIVLTGEQAETILEAMERAKREEEEGRKDDDDDEGRRGRRVKRKFIGSRVKYGKGGRRESHALLIVINQILIN